MKDHTRMQIKHCEDYIMLDNRYMGEAITQLRLKNIHLVYTPLKQTKGYPSAHRTKIINFFPNVKVGQRSSPICCSNWMVQFGERKTQHVEPTTFTTFNDACINY